MDHSPKEGQDEERQPSRDNSDIEAVFELLPEFRKLYRALKRGGPVVNDEEIQGYIETPTEVNFDIEQRILRWRSWWIRYVELHNRQGENHQLDNE